MKYILKIIFAILVLVCSCTPPQTHVRTPQTASVKHDNMVREVLRSPISQPRKTIVRTAHSLRGIPYLAGGTTPRGFDCSGFVQYVYGKAGISVPRRSDQQYANGRKISLSNTKPGDLVFFQTTSRRISHVGIYVRDGMFIHAPSSGKHVSYSSIENPYWRSRYRGSVSYLR
jgi:cell wall-associated NlpC family hydrolase